jgi:hypothetical protein
MTEQVGVVVMFQIYMQHIPRLLDILTEVLIPFLILSRHAGVVPSNRSQEYPSEF